MASEGRERKKGEGGRNKRRVCACVFFKKARRNIKQKKKEKRGNKEKKGKEDKLEGDGPLRGG